MGAQRVGIFGLGLIGASLALDLRAAGCLVLGYDRDQRHTELALAMGAIDEGLAEPAGAFDTVILAAPPRANLALLEAPAQAPLWLDTGSVKREIVARAQDLGLPFVGGHPLAGSEGEGPTAARRGLFRNRGFALCPAGGPQEQAQSLAQTLGARVIWLDAEEHDRHVARSSHLVYAWSCALASVLENVPSELLGPAAREMLRVATSPTGLWTEILEMNAPALGDAVRAARAALAEAAEGAPENLASARELARRLREEQTPDAG